MIERVAIGSFLLAAALLLAEPGVAESAGPAGERGSEILDRAFENRFDVDTKAGIELIMRSRRGGERRRLFEMVSKRLDGRLRSIGRLIEPAHLRGMTIMTIEVQGGGEDTFIYMPSLKKVRRVTTAQRADSFLGSDLTYEDFERRRTEDFVVTSLAEAELDGERVHRIVARHRRPQSYDRLEIDVAVRDHAILETRYYKRDAEVPFRRILSPRESMIEAHGHVLPTRVVAYNELRGTVTEVRLTDLEVNPELANHLFSLATLEGQRPLD